MNIAHPASKIADIPPQPASAGGEGLLSYEVHFYRADGTLSLRLHAAAVRHDDVLRALDKMRCHEFVEVKVWRGLDRAVIRHRPAIPPAPEHPEHTSE